MADIAQTWLSAARGRQDVAQRCFAAREKHNGGTGSIISAKKRDMEVLFQEEATPPACVAFHDPSSLAHFRAVTFTISIIY